MSEWVQSDQEGQSMQGTRWYIDRYIMIRTYSREFENCPGTSVTLVTPSSEGKLLGLPRGSKDAGMKNHHELSYLSELFAVISDYKCRPCCMHSMLGDHALDDITVVGWVQFYQIGLKWGHFGDLPMVHIDWLKPTS